MIPILEPKHYWECPNCDQTKTTHEAKPHTAFHICSGLRNITAPFVPVGTKCKVELKEREDYLGDEEVFMSEDGRPVMSVVTTRDDGQDCTVFARCARGSGIRGD